jgi:peroxiredoxin-like protein
MIIAGDERIRYSAPESMGGKGTGANPETLLISAVTACYSLTLLYLLRKKRLAVSELAVKTEGIVDGHPQKHRYAKIIVNSTIHGGDGSQCNEYRAVATEAHDKCFIGQTVAKGQVAFEVGKVTVA